MPTSWTEARRAEVRQGWAEGKSSGQIAGALGVTRNAIIGQLHQMKLFGGKKPGKVTRKVATPTPRPAATAKSKFQPMASGAPLVIQPVVKSSIAQVLDDVASPDSAGPHVCFADLSSRHCRWPIACDDGETRYCGAEAADGSWCTRHACRVFTSRARPDAGVAA